MLRSRVPEQAKPLMDTALIRPFESRLSRPNASGAFLSAVLFASGRLVRVEDDLRIFGLIVAGYEGLAFGDDGTYTARVASELPLQRWDGVHKLERYVDQGVREVIPSYVAEHVGFISVDEAAVFIRAFTKREHGEGVPPSELSWGSGSLSLG